MFFMGFFLTFLLQLQHALSNIEYLIQYCFFFFKVYPKSYGVLVRISITGRDFCKCEEPRCEDGKYKIQETIIRVKKDEDIRHLELFLQSQYQIWENLHPIVIDSDESE